MSPCLRAEGKQITYIINLQLRPKDGTRQLQWKPRSEMVSVKAFWDQNTAPARTYKEPSHTKEQLRRRVDELI